MQKPTARQIKAGFSVEEQQDWCDPPEEVDWQDSDFLAWKHPRGGSWFVLMPLGEGWQGMVFQMNAGAGTAGGPCQLCLATGPEPGTKAALVETWSNPRRKLGLHVCADMGCSQRVRGLRPGRFMSETLSAGRRIERLQMRLAGFAAKVSGQPVRD